MEDMLQWVIEGRYFLYHEGYLISESVAHIYHSALPLCPQTSLFRHQYENDLKSEANIVTGVNTYWPMLRRFINQRFQPPALMEFSPNGRMLCVITSKSDQEDCSQMATSYSIYNTRTCVKIMEFCELASVSYHTVTWSPDSRIIATTSRGVISLRNCRTTKESVKQTPQMSVLHFCS